MNPYEIWKVINLKFTEIIATNIFWFLSGKYITKIKDFDRYYILIYESYFLLKDGLCSSTLIKENLIEVTTPVISDNILYIRRGLFCECKKLTTVNILSCPEYGMIIEDYVFFLCKNLTTVNIGYGLARIGLRAFAGCTSLVTVNIPDSIYFIDMEAFMRCASLVSIDIPSSILYIEHRTFSKCTSLSSVNLKTGLYSIDSYAFSDCTNLKNIYVPKDTRVNYNSFSSSTRVIRY